MKNVMGLICDPVAGLVECPCIKRNALGAVNAMLCADMALAGITSLIPFDEVVAAMFEIRGVELADPVLAEARAPGNDVRSRLVANEPDCEIKPGLLPRIAVVGDSHDCFLVSGEQFGRLPSGEKMLYLVENYHIWHLSVISWQTGRIFPGQKRSRQTYARRGMGGRI
jgi:hypothetical protein